MSSSILNKLVNAIDKKAAVAKRPQRLNVQKQAQLLYNSVIAYLANENPKVLPERRVTKRAALTVVRRSLDRTRGLSFSIREYQALRDLGTFISLSQNPNNKTATFADNTDLLPLSHPLCSRRHSMTASALRQARGRWMSADPRLEDDLRPVVASAFGAPVGAPAQVHAVAQLQSVIGRFVPDDVLGADAPALVAAIGDGNSSAARRARAMLQRRDSEGQFAEMGGGRRWLQKGLDGLVSWMTGRTIAADPDTDTFDVQTSDGSVYRVPANATSGVKAVLKTDTDVEKGEARYSSKDIVLNESDVKRIDAPAGFRKYKDTLQGRTVYVSTDDEYVVTKVEKPDQSLRDTIAGIRKHNELQESLEPDKRELRELVGAGENGAWDKEKPFYIATRRDEDSSGKPKLTAIGVSQDWAETQKIIKTDEPRLDKSVEERQVKAKLKNNTWEAWQEKVKKFNEQVKANHAEHVAERTAMLKKQAADRVDSQGNPLEPGWSAVPQDEKSIRPPKEVNNVPGMYKEGGLGKELNPLDPDQGELFNADPTPEKYDVNDTEYVKNNSLQLTDGNGDVVARLEQNDDGSFRAPWILGESRGMEFKTFKDRAEFVEALKENAVKNRTSLAKTLEEAGAEQETIDAVKAENATRADIAAALDKDPAVNSVRERAADAAWADMQSPAEKAVVKLSERLYAGNVWNPTELDEMVAGKTKSKARLDSPDEVEEPSVPATQQKKAVLDEAKPFAYSAPSSAYKMDLDAFSPEGPVEGQESSDYTDDPVELSNRYTEAELRESLAKALINKQSAYDAVVDEDFDSEIDDFDPDEIVDEDAPKKPGPKPKSQKKQAADSGVKTMEKDAAPASGFGMLEFNAGSEYVPAEALYKALEEQGVDAELYTAQLYDAKLGENKNVQALLDSRKGEEGIGAATPDLADVFPTQADLDEMDSIEVPSEGTDKLQIDETDEGQAKTFELAKAMNDYKKQYNEKIAAGEVDEATESVYNDFMDVDSGDKDYLSLVEKHFDQDKFGTADDPFRALWGAWMMEGPDNGQKNVTPALYQYAQDTLGMDDEEAGKFSENIVDSYGNPAELEEAVVAIEAEPELFNSEDPKYATAQALLKMSAVNSGTNATKVWKSYDLSEDQGFADALSEEGNVVSFPPDSWRKATGDIDDVLEGKTGENTFVVVLDEGNGTTTPIGQDRELVWGQYVVEDVTDKDGNTIVRLRKLTPAENIGINEEGNYTPYLIPNENIDLPEGYNLPDTDAYASEYNGADGNEVAAGFPEGFTDSPLYIAENWETETLLDSLRIAVEPDLEEESAGYAILEYPLDGGTDILVSGQAIRDALQIQGVNTNLFFRDLAGTGDETVPPSEADVARQNKSALSKSQNPTDAIGTSIGNSFDITEWKKIGNQLGSNEGGTYEAPDGSKYYVKTPKSPLHAGNEVLASALYRRAGVDGADTFFGVDEADNMVTVSPILPDAKPDMAQKIEEPSYKKALQEGFAIDAWLANWDVAGLAMDNVVSVDGKPNRVDTGGALLMRAMGKPKGALFGDKADEWETLRDPDMNPQSAKIFADMTDVDLKTSASKLLDVTRADIDSLVAAAFPDEPVLQKTVADKLEMRRMDILERAGLTDKDTTVTANNLKNVQAHTQTIMDITGLDEENANKVRNVIDDEYGLDWSEATASETGEAIKEALNSDAYDGPLPEGFKSTNKNKKTETKAPSEPPLDTAEEEEEDELKPEDAYVIANDFADETLDAIKLYREQTDLPVEDLDLKEKLDELEKTVQQKQPVDNPDDIAELQGEVEKIADYMQEKHGKGGEFKSIAENLRIAGDVAKKDKIDVVKSPIITAEEVDASKYAKNAGATQWFDDANPPKLSDDGNFVEVTLNDIGGDMPKFGGDEGPVDLADLGVPYIVIEGEAQDNTYDVQLRVPLDKMDEFTETWNELKQADLGPFIQAPAGYYEKPENFFGDVYRDAKADVSVPEPEKTVVEAPAEDSSPVGKSLSADGKTPIAAGMKVKSTKTGEVGVVSKLDVYKKKGVVFPDYAWVKFEGKKDKQLKTTKTLQIVDDGGFPEGGPGGGEPDAPAPTEPTPSSEPAVPLSPEPTAADDTVVLKTSETLEALHDQIDKAIKDKKLLKFVYNGKERTVRPLNTWDNPKTKTKNLVAEDLGDGGKKKNFSTHVIESTTSASADPVKPKPADLPAEQKYTAPPEPQFGATDSYKVTNINDTTTFVSGTYFLNETVEYTPKELAELLGKPYEYGSGNKVQQEWSMRFESPDGAVIFARLYDWKTLDSLDPDKKYDWHIGGNNAKATELVKNLLEAKKKEKSSAAESKSATTDTPVGNPALALDKKDLDNPELYEKKDVKVENLKVGDYIPYGSGWARVASHGAAYNKGKKTHKFRMFLQHTNGNQQYVEYSGKTVIKSTRSPKSGTGINTPPPTVPNPPPPPSSSSSTGSPLKAYTPDEWADAAKKTVANNEIDFGPFDTNTSLKNGALATKNWIQFWKENNNQPIDFVTYSPYSGVFIVGIKDQSIPRMITSDGKNTQAPASNEYYKDNPSLKHVQPDSPHSVWLGVDFEKDDLAPIKDDVAPPPGANQKFKKDRFGNWLYKGVTVTDANGDEGVIYGFPGAKGYENYVQVEFLDGSKKVRSVDKVTGGRLFDQTKLTEAGPGVNVPEVDDPDLASVDWAQSEITGAGVKSLVDAVAHVQSSPAAGARGRSAAVDAGDVEDLDVHMMTVVDGDKTYTRASFKLTSWAGDALVAELLKKVPNTEEYDLFINQGIKMPKLRRDVDGNMAILKSGTQTEWEYTSSYSETTTYVITDKVTGATIRVYRANRDAKPVSSMSAQRDGLAFHNRVEILVPEQQDANSTANVIARGMKLGGVRAPRPAKKEDVRVLTENRLMSIFGKETDPSKNVVGAARVQKLKAIEKMLGLPFEQMWLNLDTPAYDLNDRLSYRTSKAIAEYMVKKTETGAITHSFGIKSSSSPDAAAQAMFNLLMVEDGLKATSVRWTEGIGGHGDSSEADIKTGGADYLFTKPKATMKPYSVATDNHAYFHFDPIKLYSRLDFWANFKDQYGKRMKETDPIGEIKPAKPTSGSGTYELMFKNGISWADLSIISVSPAVRERLVKMLLDNGVPPEKYGASSWDDLIPVKK